MSEHGGEIEDVESTGVNRRRLLKGAAATGVGLIAFSAPSITSLGGTPAYAQVCTRPATKYWFGYRNTSCDCQEYPKVNQPPDKFVNYNDTTTQQCNGEDGVSDNLDDIAYTLQVGGAGNPGGGCAPGSSKSNTENGQASVYFDDLPDGVQCQVIIQVIENNCAGSIVYGTVASEGGNSYFPLVGCGSGQGGGDVFIRAGVQCSADSFCLNAPS